MQTFLAFPGFSSIYLRYATQDTKYMVFVPALEKVIVSVHVIFNEIIPDPSAEYFAELERLMIEVAACRFSV